MQIKFQWNMAMDKIHENAQYKIKQKFALQTHLHGYTAPIIT